MASTNIDLRSALVGKGTNNAHIVKPKVLPRNTMEQKSFFSMPSNIAMGGTSRIEIPMSSENYRGHFATVANMNLEFDMTLQGVDPGDDYICTKLGALNAFSKITFYCDQQPVYVWENDANMGFPGTHKVIQEIYKRSPLTSDRSGFATHVYPINRTGKIDDTVASVEVAADGSYTLPARSINLGLLTDGWLDKQVDTFAMGNIFTVEMVMQSMNTIPLTHFIFWQNTSTVDNRAAFRLANVQITLDYVIFPENIWPPLSQPRLQYFWACDVARVALPAAGIVAGDQFRVTIGQDFPPRKGIVRMTHWALVSTATDMSVAAYQNTTSGVRFEFGHNNFFSPQTGTWVLQHDSVDVIKADSSARLHQYTSEGWAKVLGMDKLLILGNGSSTIDAAVAGNIPLVPHSACRYKPAEESESQIHLLDVSLSNERATEWELLMTPNRQHSMVSCIGPYLYCAIWYPVIRQLDIDGKTARVRVTNVMN